MGFSESDGICRNHPQQRGAPGICPSCLREKLSLLARNRGRSMAEEEEEELGFSSLPDYSTAYSPSHRRLHHRAYSIGHARNASDDRGSLFSIPPPLALGFDDDDDKNGLRKSRTVAAMRRQFVEDAAAMGGTKKEKKKKKKNSKMGFWRKTLLPSGKWKQGGFDGSIYC